MDLRLRFEMNEKAPTTKSCIIVLQYDDVKVGVIVDKISEVCSLSETEQESSEQRKKIFQSFFQKDEVVLMLISVSELLKEA